LGTPSKRSIILLHAVNDCPSGMTAKHVHHVSFAQITCLLTAIHHLYLDIYILHREAETKSRSVIERQGERPTD